MAAGMWIEWEKGLPGKPEIGRIARMLGVTRLHAAAACMEVWSWAEEQTETGIISISPEEISDAVRIPKIGEAMLAAEWLVQVPGGLAFPNWDRHNGQPAKRRALNALRMRAARADAQTQSMNKRAQSVRT